MFLYNVNCVHHCSQIFFLKGAIEPFFAYEISMLKDQTFTIVVQKNDNVCIILEAYFVSWDANPLEI